MLPPKAIKYYQTHPIEFCTNHLNMTPDQNQRPILRAIAEGKDVSARSGHAIGKTSLLAAGILHFLYTHPFSKVPCTAPTKHQLYDNLWGELAKWLRLSNIEHDFNWAATKVSIKGHESEWYAVARTARDPEGLSGFHADNILYICDEASGVDETIFEVIDGAMSTENAQMVLCGNPTRTSGRFYESHNSLRSLYECFHINCMDSSRVPGSYITNMQTKWGADSDIYRYRVQGEFPKGNPDCFFRLEKVMDAINREDIEPKGDLILGIDVSRWGSDETAVCMRRGKFVYPIETWAQCDTQVTVGKISALVRNFKRDKEYYGPITMRIDDVGLGAGVVDPLLHIDLNVHPWLKDCKIDRINFGEKGDDDFANLGTRAWGGLRSLIDEIRLPEDDDLVGQLTTRVGKTQPTGRIMLESKDQMKKRGFPSPDRADALSMAFADFVITPELHVY